MWKEFQAFVVRGNVLGPAVGVIVGVAGAVVAARAVGTRDGGSGANVAPPPRAAQRPAA